jgi:hypothetical protein
MKKCRLQNPSIITFLVVLLSSTLGKCVEAINNQKSPPLLQRHRPLVSLDGTAGSNRGAALGVEKIAFTRDVMTSVSGGECCDSTSILLGKVGVGAGEQTYILLLILCITTTSSHFTILTIVLLARLSLSFHYI